MKRNENKLSEGKEKLHPLNDSCCGRNYSVCIFFPVTNPQKYKTRFTKTNFLIKASAKNSFEFMKASGLFNVLGLLSYRFIKVCTISFRSGKTHVV